VGVDVLAGSIAAGFLAVAAGLGLIFAAFAAFDRGKK